MRVSRKTGELIAKLLAMFIINLVIFLFSKLFVSISWTTCFVATMVNTIWMTFLLLPVLEKISSRINKKEDSYRLKPLLQFFENFEKRQEEIKIEIEEEEKLNRQLGEKFKFNWKLYKKYLRQNGINKIYHFTDYSNINSIIENGGLYSWYACKKNGIKISKPGASDLSRNLDLRDNIENFVRLSFTPDNPMMYMALREGRISKPVILELEPELIYWHGTKYSNVNATKRNKVIGDTIEFFKAIKFSILKKGNYLKLSNEEKPFYQAEILVKEKIPLNMIKNIQLFEN